MSATTAQQSPTLIENFQKYFRVEYASTIDQRDAAYRIRYRVYCEEFGYEPKAIFPDQLEHDEYDDDAFHCLVTQISGMPTGCVRLVPATDEPGSLPFERYCGESVDQGMIDSLGLDRSSMCEISRLAVDGAFRRRSGEALTRFGEIEAMDCSQREKRTFSLIAVAASLASIALAEVTDRTDIFAMMEPFLPRLLRRSGIIFSRVGKDIDYHGIRAPYFMRVEETMKSMRPDLRELYDVICIGIRENCDAK